MLKGGAPIYFYAIMNAPGKEKDKECTLDSKLAELVGLLPDGGGEPEEPYVDLTITCVAKDDSSDQILDGVPPLRVKLVAAQPGP